MSKQSLEQVFEENIRNWKSHIVINSYSSNISDYLTCPAYHNLVAMGKKVLPLIRTELDVEISLGEEADEELRKINRKIFGRANPDWEKEKYSLLESNADYFEWQKKYAQKMQENPYAHLCALVSEIAGEEFQIPKSIKGKVHDLAIYTLGWLNGYLSK